MAYHWRDEIPMANLEEGRAMPRPQVMVRREVPTAARPAVGSRDETAPTSAVNAAQPRPKVLHPGRKKVPAAICRTLRQPMVEGHQNIPADGPAVNAGSQLSATGSMLVATPTAHRVTDRHAGRARATT